MSHIDYTKDFSKNSSLVRQCFNNRSLGFNTLIHVYDFSNEIGIILRKEIKTEFALKMLKIIKMVLFI